MTNHEIAAVFEQIADLLEFQGANPFRVRAYRNAARTIHDLPESAADIVADPERSLTEIEGIGKDLAEKVATLVETGSLPMLDELLAEVPESVLAILRVPGLGPKRAAQLYHELKVATLDDLRAACESHQIQELKGFGAKMEAAILQGLDIASEAEQRILWIEADQHVQEILAHMNTCKAVRADRRRRQLSPRQGNRRRPGFPRRRPQRRRRDGPPGRLRRRRPRSSPGATRKCRCGWRPACRSICGRLPPNRSAPRCNTSPARRSTTSCSAAGPRRGAENQRVRRLPRRKTDRRPHGRRRLRHAGPALFSARAARGPAGVRVGRRRPAARRWSSLRDIRGDLHMHSTWTDGTATIEEMAAAAKQRGLKYIAITDHSKRVTMVGGLDAKRLRQAMGRNRQAQRAARAASPC